MDVLSLSLERETDGRGLQLDGIYFSDVAFVRISIDGEDLRTRPPFSDAVSEVVKGVGALAEETATAAQQALLEAE